MEKRTSLIIGLIIFALSMVFVSIMLFYGSRETKVAIEDEQLKISGMYGTAIKLSDIDQVTLENTLPEIKEKVNGFDLGNILRGDFSLEGYGTSKIYLIRGAQPYIYIHQGGKLIIINFKDSEKTKKLYEDIKTALKH